MPRDDHARLTAASGSSSFTGDVDSLPILATVDVAVVGTGNAACSAALSAVEVLQDEHGGRPGGSDGKSSVLMIDSAPETERGGNTFYTAGSMRTTFDSLSEHLMKLPLHNVSPESDLAGRIDMPAYSKEDFWQDMCRVTENRCHKEMTELLIDESWAGIQWLASYGVRFRLPFERQAYEYQDAQGNKRWRFWGGLYINTVDGGKGLVHDEHKACVKAGVRIEYKTKAEQLISDSDGKVSGLIVSRPVCETSEGDAASNDVEALRFYRIEARRGVVLTCGGYESNGQLRSELLGSQWAAAYVRGTPYNQGSAFHLAEPFGAARRGQFGDGACHSTCWDAKGASPIRGDVEMTNQYTKSGYPLGLFLDSTGRRFVDEGEDMRNYTYAKMGRAILRTPGSLAIQVWDQKTIPLLRDEEYSDENCKHKVLADTLEELADKLAAMGAIEGEASYREEEEEEEEEQQGLDGHPSPRVILSNPAAFVDEIKQFNAVVYAARKSSNNAYAAQGFDPSIKDGLCAPSPPLAVPKSNWALPIDQGPFLAVVVTTGITFTFGGLAIDPSTAQVLRYPDGTQGSDKSQALEPIPGLFAAGEAAGGLFSGNYPGGTGLTAGTVFGRRAGRFAASGTSQPSLGKAKPQSSKWVTI